MSLKTTGLGPITTKTKLYQSGPVKDNSYTGDEVMNTYSSQVYVETEGPYDLSVAAEANVAAIERKFHVDLP